jgi:hypothetical protein
VADDIRYDVLIDNQSDDRITADLSHIQVVESVREMTTFLVRVEIDVCGTNLSLIDDPTLQPQGGSLMTIVAFVNGASKVLAHGLITNQSKRIIQGGPGSYIEVMGADRRIEMDRNFTPTAGPISGTADLIVTPILSKYKFKVDADQSQLNFDQDHPFSQTTSDLRTVTQLAIDSGVEFWLDWDLSTFSVVETAHFKSQPPLNNSPGGGGFGVIGALLSSLLAPPDTSTLSINTGDGSNSINEFGPSYNSEMPNQTGDVWRVDIDHARLVKANIPGPTQNPLGGAVPTTAPFTSSFPTAGDADRATSIFTSAVNDSGWRWVATTATTAHAACGLIRPRQLITVKGTGTVDDGQWFVWKVSHDITPADHKMSLELRRNTQGPV